MGESINRSSELEIDLLELDITLDVGSSLKWKQKSYILKFEEVIWRLIEHREELQKVRIQKDFIAGYLFNMESHARQRIIGDFQNTVSFDSTATDRIEELSRLVTHDNYEPMVPIVLKHILWTTKRRLFDKTVYCPIFLNVYGPAGSGKSEFVKSLFSPFPSCLKSSVGNAAELFNDERQHFRFVDSFVISMDELTGLNKTDICKLKNQIDATDVVYRVLGFNKTATGTNNAQLIGTSNTRLRSTISSVHDIRKWAEIDIFPWPDDEVPQKMVTPLHNFDWLSLWRSIDENSESPFHDPETYKQFKKWTFEKCRSETPTSHFITEFAWKNPSACVLQTDLYNDYCIAVKEKQMGLGNFKEELIKFGFVQKRKNAGMAWSVPARKGIEINEEKDDNNEDLSNI